MRSNIYLPNALGKHEKLKEYSDCSFLGIQKNIVTGLTLIQGANDGLYRKQTDDLTFIIPYATDIIDRKYHLSKVLAWIMSTTTAKVIIVSAENKDSLKRFTAPPAGSIDNLPPTWQQYEKADGALASYMYNHMYNGICNEVFRQGYLKKKLNLDFLTDRFGPNKTNDESLPGVKLRNQLLERIKWIIVPREVGSPFHRMRYLNLAIKAAETPYVCNHDCDILLSNFGLMTSLSYLRNNTAHVVYPYARDFDSQKRVFRWNAQFPWEPLPAAIMTGDMEPLISGYSVLPWMAAYGHSILFNRESYISIGGENESFVSWGAEDLERYQRAIRLGLIVARVDGPVIHLEHARNENSSDKNPHFKKNEKNWNDIQKMNDEDFRKYCANMEHRKKYGW